MRFYICVKYVVKESVYELSVGSSIRFKTVFILSKNTACIGCNRKEDEIRS